MTRVPIEPEDGFVYKEEETTKKVLVGYDCDARAHSRSYGKKGGADGAEG